MAKMDKCTFDDAGYTDCIRCMSEHEENYCNISNKDWKAHNCIVSRYLNEQADCSCGDHYL